ncbi:MAG: SDR family oxidoreductase [Gammaproteobacteria bacterium]|nr:SDR family oxidoreductase [Gammaproteobacteria bacterium]
MTNPAFLQTLFDLSPYTAVVTGASSGIGREMAIVLAAAGARVVLVARRHSALEATARRIGEQGGAAAVIAAELAERGALAEVAARCRASFGAPDIVVNAAGINLREPAEAITAESWDRTIELNLAAPFFFTRELVPAMIDKGYGRIINIASLQSRRAFANGLAYGAAKGGLTQLTRAMALAWSAHGIMCNAIAPGFFPTELTAPVFSDPERERWAAEQTMVGRNGRLEDLAGITVFLASPACNYITGQTLAIDGGFTAR